MIPLSFNDKKQPSYVFIIKQVKIQFTWILCLYKKERQNRGYKSYFGTVKKKKKKKKDIPKDVHVML